ncbi:oligosaccharide flippase family protein [Robiginitalea sp. SC105]|uniref:oligosaccharide flippase family protein n=1 Tax=Robiginitalea sp. SC105 TaxID=2762332 RepID=UPI0016397A8E|nr:oligosaccharide flippase family protein [Robiginitalea sp. SC105]MBC2839279.1 oligosaccharide flippase family protein [Robiginitalea sp. SC105]
MNKPAVTFIVPVKSTMVTHSWSHFSALFERSLKSILNQTSANFRVVVICHEKPDTTIEHPNVHYLHVDFNPPALLNDNQEVHWSLKEQDKCKKILAGIEFVNENPTPFVMVTDADDCISNRVVEIVEKHSSPEVQGWYFKKGWIYQEGSGIIYLNINNFSTICGSGIIIRPELIEDLIIRHPNLHYAHEKKALNSGQELLPFPIPGTVYSIINGENHYMSSAKVRERIYSKNRTGLARIQGLFKKLNDNRFRILNTKIRKEFGLYKVRYLKDISRNLLFGAKWISVQIVLSKIFSILGQFALAWILLPDDFGKMAMALSITSFAFLFQNFGLQDVLINRGKSFNVLLPLSQSISLVTGLLCLLVTVGLGFLGGIIYEDIQITHLVLIYSLSVPFNALSTVSESKLRIDLRFKEVSKVQIKYDFLNQLLILGLALFSFGVYSFVISPVILSILRLLYLNNLADIKITKRLTLRRWKHLVSNSSWGFLHAASQRVIQQADYLVLGLFVIKATVGIYYLAYSLSVQVIGFVVNSITPVLFPTLMKIPKSRSGEIPPLLVKFVIFLSMAGMPFALWQAATAQPLVTLFLEEKWNPTIPLIQMLSLGIGFSVIGTLWPLSLKLRGDFRKQAKYSIFSALLFLGLIIPFTYAYSVKGTIISVAIFHVFASPFLTIRALKFYGVDWYEVLSPILKYFAISMLVFGFCFFLSREYIENLYLVLLINGIFAPVIYLLILYLSDSYFHELLIMLKAKR